MSRLRPLRAVGLGTVLGLGVAYPVAHLYSPSAPLAAAAVAAPAAVVVQPAAPAAGAPAAASAGPDPSATATSRSHTAHRAAATPTATASPAGLPAASATPPARSTRRTAAATTSAPPAPKPSAKPTAPKPTPKPTPSPKPTPKPTPTPTSRTLRVTGPSVQTPYGAVQVQVTVVVTGSNERITAASAVRLPSGGTSSQISAYAGPRLDQETLAAQSANIHTVSGASYTSAGYRSSLQAALVAARRAG